MGGKKGPFCVFRGKQYRVWMYNAFSLLFSFRTLSTFFEVGPNIHRLTIGGFLHLLKQKAVLLSKAC